MGIDLSKIKSIFFIGIGGIGISALAKMAFSKGLEVSGVNDEEGKTLDSLREFGIKVTLRGAFGELPEADMYVYSDAWLYRGPELIEAARRAGKPTMNNFEALGLFSKDYKVIAIAGTHGKTTTTAMVSEILIDAGLDPTCIVGSFVKKFDSNFRFGQSQYLVVEADEYNRHFLNFHPFVTLVTNIEADHLDYYKDLEDIKEAFSKLYSQSQNVIKDYSQYLDMVPDLKVPGTHNKLDAALALALADFLHLDMNKAKKSLSAFEGTWRRLEKKGKTEDGSIVYDDYAHHPTEIRASLQALRELYPRGGKRITVLFQPHLYSRTKALFKEFTECFADADNVFILPIYFAREEKDPSISSEILATGIREKRGEAVSFSDFKSAEEWLKGMKFDEKDIIVGMGAGEQYQVIERVFKIV